MAAVARATSRVTSLATSLMMVIAKTYGPVAILLLLPSKKFSCSRRQTLYSLYPMFKLNLRKPLLSARAVNIDSQLAKRFNAGECDAFTEIYNVFKAPLFSFLLRRTESVNVAEDLSHDIFLKVLKSRDLYDPNQEFAPWFWTVARNTLNDHLRKKVHLAQNVPVEGPEAEAEGVTAIVSTADIETIVVKGSDRAVLLKFLSQLTKLQREALSLRLVQKLSYAEISKRMSLSLSAVKSLIHRAQGSIKSSFRKEQKRELRMLNATDI
jgi:RNA polymerase sigma-70 factor (ECF subfamily)